MSLMPSLMTFEDPGPPPSYTVVFPDGSTAVGSDPNAIGDAIAAGAWVYDADGNLIAGPPPPVFGPPAPPPPPPPAPPPYIVPGVSIYSEPAPWIPPPIPAPVSAPPPPPWIPPPIPGPVFAPPAPAPVIPPVIPPPKINPFPDQGAPMPTCTYTPGSVLQITYIDQDPNSQTYGMTLNTTYAGPIETLSALRPQWQIIDCTVSRNAGGPPPPPPPPPAPTSAQVCSGQMIAPPLPTPAPANVPAKITLQVAPTFPPSPPQSALPPPGCVTLVVGGRQRASSDPVDMQNAITGGASVLRADGSFAMIQSLTAPGWPPDNYLIDGNPITAVLGQGFMPGQLDLINQLVAAGLTIPPTLAPGAPHISPVGITTTPLYTPGGTRTTPPVITGSVSGISPLALAGGAVLLYLLFRK